MSKCDWAMRAFNDWKALRNELAIQPKFDISPFRVEFIEMTKDESSYSLQCFVLEVRKQNGEEYPAETLYELIISLQLYLSCHGKEYRFLDDPDFRTLKNTLDCRMKELSAAGKRVKRKQAEVIDFDEEDKLWTSVLGTDTPQKLLDTLFCVWTAFRFTCWTGTQGFARHRPSSFHTHR